MTTEYELNVYKALSDAPPEKAYLGVLHHPRIGMLFHFTGATEEEVEARAEEFWAKDKEKRDQNWAKRDAAKAEKAPEEDTSQPHVRQRFRPDLNRR